jgi:hypothetical protein
MTDAPTTDADGPRIIYGIPPRSSLKIIDPAHGRTGLAMPFWLYWAEIASTEATCEGPSVQPTSGVLPDSR